MTALANGDALVTGGTNVHQGAFAGAERYVAQANEWRAAGAMSSPRYRHTATLLNDGRVIVAGGSNSNAPCNCTTFLSAVDLYDPATNQWTATGALLTARYAHTATRLDNGKILVAGGFGGIPDTLSASGSPLGTVELYDPATGVWSPVAAMNASRTEHTATLLPSGLVLVTAVPLAAGSLASAGSLRSRRQHMDERGVDVGSAARTCGRASHERSHPGRWRFQQHQQRAVRRD